jgi:hypothetical protein
LPLVIPLIFPSQQPIFCGVGPITHSYAPFVKQAMLAAKARGVTNTFFIDYQVWRTSIIDSVSAVPSTREIVS